MGWHGIPSHHRDTGTPRGERYPRRAGDGMPEGLRAPSPRGCSRPPRRASVSPAGNSPVEQPRDARTDGRHLRRGKAGERRCSGPSRGGGADFITGQERQNWFGAQLGQRHKS